MKVHPARLFVQVQGWSLRNRILARLRRLKQIKYLVFTAVSLAYLLGVTRPWRAARVVGIMSEGSTPPPYVLPAIEAGIGLLLTFLCLFSWVWPRSRPALDFTETEVAFLFPAPLTRRQVIDYALLKKQAGVLFGAFMTGFFALRAFAHSLVFAVLGLWLAFAVVQLHFMATGILRANLAGNRAAGLRRARGILAGIGVVVLAIASWAIFWLRPPLISELHDPARLAAYLSAMADAGPMGILLWPGRVLARVILAPGWLPFCGWLVPSFGLLAAHYFWVVRSDFAYEEASADQAARKAQHAAGGRGGRRARRLPALRRRRPPFPLAASGRPEVALIWKNLIAAGRIYSLRNLALFAPLILGGAALARTYLHGDVPRSLMAAFGIQAIIFAGILLLLGPTLLRSDLRSDLTKVSILKTLPLSGQALVLGEVLTPTILVTLLQTLLLAFGILLAPWPEGWSGIDLLALALAFLIQALPLNMLSALIQNAAVLLFPAWHALGPDRARGFEAIGQRMLSSLLFLFALAVAYIPAGLIFGLGLWFAQPHFGWLAAPPLGLVAALPAAVEAGFGVLLVGWVFERFDPSKELDSVS
jgi:hypothetical protein